MSKKKEKLIDVLKKYEGKIVRLGSNTAYVYCGEVNERIEDILNVLSDEELDSLKNSLKNREKYKEDFNRIWEKKRDELPDVSEDTLEKYEIYKAEDWYKTLAKIWDLKQRIKNWTAFPVRTVKEIYNSDVTDDVIIIFDGKEHGKYWDCEEFQAAKGVM